MARTVSPAVLAHLQARRGFVVRLLFWALPRNLTTGLPEEIGIWTGSTPRDFVIAGQTRTYMGGGGVLQIANIVSAVGLDIRNQRVTLNNLFPEVAALLTQFDADQAPVEIHRALFWPDSRELAEEPHRLFKGTIDKAPQTRAEAGGTPVAEITLASSARKLTQALAARQSDASQRQRLNDRFLRYADLSAEIVTPWGEAG